MKEEFKIIRTTLCYLIKDDKVLMLFRNKKKNDMSEGKWVGIGGKFEQGEDADTCMKREIKEETGLDVTKAHFHGVIHFVSDTWNDEDMYLYTATEWQGNDDFNEKSEDSFICSEGELVWIKKDEVLKLNLWEGDKYFLKPLLAGQDKISMTCKYSGYDLVEVY